MQPVALNRHAFARHTLGLAVSAVLLATLNPVSADELLAVDGPMGTAIVDVQAQVPIVGIVAPNAQGLSHNRWQDYNVGTAGLVLNNSLSAGQAQIGGVTLDVDSNAQFSDRAASVILNEVVGSRGSTVAGEQVIFGQAADYVLSNPNGIVLNGARLALEQANTATFAVATAELGDGRIQSYDTRAAQPGLVVGQDGVDGGAGSVQLIAPSLQTYGELTAGRDLSLLLGRQRLDAQTLTASDITQAPTAVDASLLGAMHARRIKIISTHAGAGVNMGVSRLRAAQGIEITSAGALTMSSAVMRDGQHAQASIDAGTADLRLASSGDMTLTSLALSGQLIDARAGGRLTFDALSNQTLVRRQATADDQWFTLAPGELDARIEERALRHVGNSVMSTSTVRLDGNGIEMAATRIEGPEFVGMYTVRGGLKAGAKVDKSWRTVRLGSSDAPEDSASTYVERAQSTHIQGGSIALPSAKLTGAWIDGAQSVSISGFGETDISGLDLKRTSTQGSGVRRVTLSGSRAHEAYREDVYQQQAQINARDGDLSIGGEGIRISAARLAGAKVSVDSQGDLVIVGSSKSVHLEGARPGADEVLRSFERTSQGNASTVVTARDTLSLRARGSRFRAGNITVAGSHLSANQAVNIDAHSNLWISGMVEQESFKLSGPQWGPVPGELQDVRWSNAGFRESQARSSIAGDSVRLTAGDMLDVAGAALDSHGDIKLAASDIQLTGSLEAMGLRNEAVWLDNDLPGHHFVAADDEERARITDRIHNGFSMKAGGDIGISAQRLATHAASVTAAGQLTISDNLAFFKDTPVDEGDAIRRHYHGHVFAQQSSWGALAGVPLAALDVSLGASKGTTLESSFVAGGVGVDTAQRVKDMNIPLTLR